jgi:hypothetical protein
MNQNSKDSMAVTVCGLFQAIVPSFIRRDWWNTYTNVCQYSRCLDEIRTGHLQNINFVYHVNTKNNKNVRIILLFECRPRKSSWKNQSSAFIRYDTDHMENDTSNNYSPTIIRCRGNVFNKLLPSNNKGIQKPADSLIKHILQRKWRVQEFVYFCVYALSR